MSKRVIEGYQHASRDVEKLAVDLENFGCSGKILL